MDVQGCRAFPNEDKEKSTKQEQEDRKIIKGSLEDTSELRRVEERCDWKGEGSRGDVN